MKNCRNKLKKRNWSDADFAKRLTRGGKLPGNLSSSIGKAKPLGKSLDEAETFLTNFHATGTDEEVHDSVAYKELVSFVEDNGEFAEYLRDSQNWEHEGEDENGAMTTVPFRSKFDNDCCGGLIEQK